jgi:non-ribosomal peptide synthetase component E (peptide arylation enzyme)
MRAYLALHDPAKARQYYELGVWGGDTFYSLMASHARQHPAELAVRDRRLSLDWQTLKAWTDGMAADLRAQGLVQGDRVCIWISNRLVESTRGGCYITGVFARRFCVQPFLAQNAYLQGHCGVAQAP